MNPNLLYILLPAIIGYGTAMICPMDKSSSGNNVKFRPPSYVFGIAWFILFFALGFSWNFAIQNSKNKVLCNTAYAITTLSLGLWTYVYVCKKSKVGGVWVLVLSLAACLASFAQGNVLSKSLIAPLIAWIIFAMIMNTTEVQNTK
jgi:tryptophan-rich sensory protein